MVFGLVSREPFIITFLNYLKNQLKSYHFVVIEILMVIEEHSMELPANTDISIHKRAKELQNILKSLTEDYRIPFMLFYRGFDYEAIAGQLNVPVGIIKNRIFLAQKQLRQTVLEQHQKVHLQRA